MQNEIVKYLSKYISISEQVKQVLIDTALVKTYDKGTILLKEGEMSTESFLVLKGCIRSFYLIEGVERTTAFYT